MTKEELKEYVNKGVQVSMDALDKAGKAVSKFGDESILKIEIQQFKSQIKKDKAELGELAWKTFCEDNSESLSKNNEKVSAILENINKAQNEIMSREEKLKG